MRALAGLGFALVALAAAAQSRQVHLLSEVAVRRDNVRLSDLLPAEASVRMPAEAIDLGRTPQPGSFRVFTREQLRRRIGGGIEVEIPEQVVVRRPLADLEGNSRKLSPQRHNVAALVDPRRPASLIFEAQAIRIQLQVIPLRKAGLGETVRVLDPVTRRVLVAQVAGEGLLEIRGESPQTRGAKP